MTATDELREGLRKRGESWHKWPDDYSTTWQAYSNPHTATESMDGTLIVTGLTPEQAVEATLGRGTCKNRDADIYPGGMVFVCSACEEMSTDGQPSYCPNCGAKVVE